MKMTYKNVTEQAKKEAKEFGDVVIEAFDFMIDGRVVETVSIRKVRRMFQGLKATVYEVWSTTKGLIYSGLNPKKAKREMMKRLRWRKRRG
ncbi:MAG: hypothetical protein ACE5KE_00705 [Methanosarcinales archaeon]